jgi:hypothetical protein
VEYNAKNHPAGHGDHGSAHGESHAAPAHGTEEKKGGHD